MSWICLTQSLQEEVWRHPQELAQTIGFEKIESSDPTMDSPVFYQFLVEKILCLQEQIER